jgi:hypothetical protein
MKTDKKSLLSTAFFCLIIGGGLWFFSQRIVCMPFTEKCYLITSDSNTPDVRGVELTPAVASVVAPASYLILGLGGIALLANLIKPEEKSE